MLMNCFKKDKNTNETQFEQKFFHLQQRKSSNRATLLKTVVQNCFSSYQSML